MACGRPVVNQRPASSFGQETRNIRNSDFHFQRRGHAVQGFQAVILRVLAVGVQVDKTRSDDETSRACFSRTKSARQFLFMSPSWARRTTRPRALSSTRHARFRRCTSGSSGGIQKGRASRTTTSNIRRSPNPRRSLAARGRVPRPCFSRSYSTKPFRSFTRDGCRSRPSAFASI